LPLWFDAAVALLIVAVLADLFALATVLRATGPRAATVDQGVAVGLITALRVVGLVLVVLVASHIEPPRNVPIEIEAIAIPGAMLIAAFLWLVISGFFGYGSARRSDWVALVPFLIALVIREVFTLHSVQEIEIYFATAPVDKHSVVHPLLQTFFFPIVLDPHRFTMHMNGVLGALACLPMYVFVRQRMRSRTAAFLCALFLAVHPLVARFSPTDGPHALLLFSWFSGLALLSAHTLDARAIFGGFVLLGIAATLRIEGMVYLAAALAILDLRALAAGVWRHRAAAAIAILAVAALVALQMHFTLRFNLGNVPPIPTVEVILRPITYGGPLFAVLVAVGAASGIVMKPRLGLFVCLAMLLVSMPVADSLFPIALHRLVPVFALQAMLAGIGAYALTAWIPTTGHWRWCATLPGIVAAGNLLVQNGGDLTRSYVFNEEYDLVRRHLAPNGESSRQSTLMTFKPWSDFDVHDFAPVVPGITVLNCHDGGCVAAARRGSSYYLRSAACYFHSDGVPAACKDAATAGTEQCLNEASAGFEASVELEAIEVRGVDLWETFREFHGNYPRRADIGLFRVFPEKPEQAGRDS
jgi:hypothetical protein